MLNRTIDVDVDMQQNSGPIRMTSYAEGTVYVTGPQAFTDGDDPYVSFRIEHEGNGVEDDGEEFATADYGSTSITLDMKEVETLYWALNDIMYNEEPETLFDETMEE